MKKMGWVLGCALGALAFAGCSNETSDDGAGGQGGESATGGSSSEGDACSALCSEFGYSGSEEFDYGGGVVECECRGDGSDLEQQQCSDYCAPRDVAPEHSYLSSTEDSGSSLDKCVCDGTAG